VPKVSKLRINVNTSKHHLLKVEPKHELPVQRVGGNGDRGGSSARSSQAMSPARD